MSTPTQGAEAGGQAVTTEIIQQYLVENQTLILAILENQNLGKLTECAQYQQRLQQNLMFLAAMADAGAAAAAPPAPNNNPETQGQGPGPCEPAAPVAMDSSAVPDHGHGHPPAAGANEAAGAGPAAGAEGGAEEMEGTGGEAPGGGRS